MAQVKITPFLWFNTEAEAAARFYTSVFKDSKITKIARYGDTGPGAKGSVMVVDFQIAGQEVTALNGGPDFKLTEAFSFVVHCRNQQEIDEYWSKLTADGGQEVECGWVKDKFGLSWQVWPDQLGEWLSDKDPEKSNRVMHAVLQMKKLDLATLKDAADGKVGAYR